MPLPPIWRQLLVAAGIAHAALSSLAAPTDGAWSIRTWRSDEGLPNNQVSSLAQTADGFLWVASPSRPVRFDGVAFEEFQPRTFAPELNQRVSALATTARGLWVGMDHGAVAFLDGSPTTRLVTAGLPDRVALSLLEDRDGTLWVVYRSGVTFRIPRKGGVQPCTAAEGFPNGYVCSLALDAAGEVWFGKDGRIGVFRAGKFVVLAQLPRRTTRLAAAREGGVWACIGTQLFRVHEGESPSRRGQVAADEAATEPTALLEDRDGSVWIGTSDRGLFHYNGHGFENVPTSHRAISSLLQDREGSVWVGTDGGGLNRVRPRFVRLENMSTGLPFDTVQSVAEDAQHTIWIVTQNGLLARSSGAAWELVSQRPDWPGGRPTCVAADRHGAVWIATKDTMIHRWRDGSFRSWRREDGVLGRTAHALVASRNGDVWIGGESPDILQCIRNDRLLTFPLPTGIRVIRAMVEDAAGDLWLGTSRGALFRVHQDKVSDETARVSGPSGPRSVRGFHATADGKLWIAFADDGIGLIADGRFGNVTTEHGLPDNNLSQLAADDHGWLWLGGDHGIFKVRREEIEAVAWGRASRVSVSRLGQNENLSSLQASSGDTPGALRASDGRIWMPLRTALAVIDPSSPRNDLPPPPVLIRRITVNDHVVAAIGGVMPTAPAIDLTRPGFRLRLPASHRRLEIDYTALGFTAPENVRFRYRLAGFDDDWVEAGAQRSARYARLPAGEYQFTVLACNGDGVWNETGASVPFTVAPFVWQTWWFRVAAVALAFAATLALVRAIAVRRLWRKVQRLQAQMTLDRERARIARDMHDDLGSRLTHAALLVELAQRAPAETREARIGQLAATVRRASESLDEIVWAVNPSNDTLPRLLHYIAEYAVEFLALAGIRGRVDLPDELPARPLSPEIRHHVFLSVKEALTNIARHAHATEVWIRTVVGADRFTIVVEDNGCGFSARPDDGRADGLRNLRQRMDEIGGTIEIDSTLGAGARLTFSVPTPRVSAVALRSAADPSSPHGT